MSVTPFAITFQVSAAVEFTRALEARIIPALRRLERILLGPKAPPRRRPRRVAKRHGRLRFSPFNIGCKRPRSAS